MGKSLLDEIQEYARRSSPEYVQTTLDTMNALTWPGPGTEYGIRDRENLAQARLRKMDRGSPERREVLTLADSLYKNYGDEIEDYYRAEDRAEDRGQRMPSRFPHWKNLGVESQIQAQADAFVELDRRKMVSFRRPVSALSGGEQQALQQNGMVWLDGKKWVRDPNDPNRLMILEH